MMSVLSSPAASREVVAHAVPVGAFVDAYASMFNATVELCNKGSTISGRFILEDSASFGQALAEAGRKVEFAADGTIRVDCAASNYAPAAWLDDKVAPLSSAVLSRPPVAAVHRSVGQDMTLRQVETRYVKKARFDPLEALGLRVLGDPNIPGPILLAGPAKIVQAAEEYIRSVDVCPRQLRVEATVVSRSNSKSRARNFGLRIGDHRIGFGTAGTGDTGLSFTWLSGWLEAARGTYEAATNASFVARILEGEELKLTDGEEVPVRTATTVTDRETRDSIVYRNAGHSLALKALAFGENEVVLQADHSISALAGVTNLGPTFSNRGTSSTFRIRYREPFILSLTGTDRASRRGDRGILFRSDELDSSDGGSFLVLAVDQERCAAFLGLVSNEGASTFF
ncbi:hypothetical protein L6Q21_13110 [Sandaracinobacter sp. RS1-74]|uniref:hypothetical protein n=1 Tax=Sandaracinobacteroides sayramensis TaxID=2913411 RepID=UPI001EDBEE01|nr:hypothetical protein [Sandaracinobacteroides sayramensis]MCG2841922.1 hypothetical protein [Sandaracinobacteroides sayramensis]